MSLYHKIFIFGYGYTAAALSKTLLAEKWSIAATTRNADKRKELHRLGIHAVDFSDSSLSSLLSQCPYVLITIPPTKQGDAVLLHYREALLAHPRKWVGYLSTTGVYGDYAGDWVDENSPLLGTGPRLRQRIEAEQTWLKLHSEHGIPVHIFRLAGIYGPGRGPLAKLQAGTAQWVDKPGQVFSRIHADDIAHTLYTSIQNPTPGEIYNLADDAPAPPQEVLNFAAKLLDLEAPSATSWHDAALSPMVQEFYAANRRVSNKKIKEKLELQLQYPTYREGLQALIPHKNQSCTILA